MGFFDTYNDESSGLSYVDAEERAVLIKNKTPLEIQRIFQSEAGQYGPKYTIVFDLEGEERAWSFGIGKVESRDRMLEAMAEYLDTEEEVELPTVIVYKVKQSTLLKDANAA